MDRVYKIRRASREMASAYIPGDCHICHQSNVKVRRLKCGMHNYCRLCYEFEPKLSKGEFSCIICMEKMRPRAAEGKFNRGSFYSRHSAKDANLEVPTTTVKPDEHKNDEFEDKVFSEENDLDGYNTEWDHLLEANHVTHTFPSNKSPNQRARNPPLTHECAPALQKIPKKSSYIHLVLPSAKTDNSDSENEAAIQPIAHTVTELLDLGPVTEAQTNKSSPSSPLNCANLRSKLGGEILPKPRKHFGAFEMDPAEIERGTSPCKGIRPQKSYIWSDDTFSIDPSYSETEQMLEQIGTIEGPAFASSSSCSSSASGSEGVGSESSAINLGDEAFWD